MKLQERRDLLIQSLTMAVDEMIRQDDDYESLNEPAEFKASLQVNMSGYERTYVIGAKSSCNFPKKDESKALLPN